MKKITIAVSVLSVLFSGAAFAKAMDRQHDMPVDRDIKKGFGKDKMGNADGIRGDKMRANKMKGGKMKDSERRARFFDKLDQNGDGAISKAEWMRGKPAKGGEKGERMGKHRSIESIGDAKRRSIGTMQQDLPKRQGKPNHKPAPKGE